MRKILIPTDFSPVADNALNYAIEIAAKFKSELHMHHVYSVDLRRDYDLSYPADEQPYVKNLEQKMNSAKQRISEKIAQKGLELYTKVSDTHILTLFKKTVRQLDIDLIIMGTKGASGITKIIFGSVAATALELADAPLLVVPPVSTFGPVKNIVLAVDLKEVSASVLLPLQKLALKYEAQVTILNVNSSVTKDFAKEIELSLMGVETSYREVPMSKSINESINDFIENNPCDLLCMIRREKGFFESIFKKSRTIDQVSNTIVPLLVLRS